MLYSDEIWEKWSKSVQDGFEKKKYLHFDHRFDFPKQKEELKAIVRSVNAVKAHSFLPLIKILFKTPRFRYQEADDIYALETKVRPISFASHFDTYIFSFYSYALNLRYQDYIIAKGYDTSILAYRSDLSGKCNIQFAKEVFDYVKKIGECTAIALDIKGYFDSIDHKKLKEKWCKIIGKEELPEDQYKIFRSLTKYTYINKNSLLKHLKVDLKGLVKEERPSTLTDLIPGSTFKEKFDYLREYNFFVTNEEFEIESNGNKRFYGVPQGTALSALLSNIYLIDFDQFIYELGKEYGFLYRRYCDDILIVAPSHEAIRIEKIVKQEIFKYHLTIQDKKTEIIKFKKDSAGKLRAYDYKKIREEKITNDDYSPSYFKNLQYLGFEFNGRNVYIRPGSLSRYFRKMKIRIGKTVLMAYSSQGKSDRIYKQQLFHRYTHLGKRNFLSYAYNASKKYYINSKGEKKEGLDSPAIRRQLSKHFQILLGKLERTNDQRILFKKKKQKLKKEKKI